MLSIGRKPVWRRSWRLLQVLFDLWRHYYISRRVRRCWPSSSGKGRRCQCTAGSIFAGHCAHHRLRQGPQAFCRVGAELGRPCGHEEQEGKHPYLAQLQLRTFGCTSKANRVQWWSNNSRCAELHAPNGLFQKRSVSWPTPRCLKPIFRSCKSGKISCEKGDTISFWYRMLQLYSFNSRQRPRAKNSLRPMCRDHHRRQGSPGERGEQKRRATLETDRGGKTGRKEKTGEAK